MKSAKRMIGIIAALIITIAVATTSTFAWFSLNTLVTVDGIEITVQTNEGISVSTTADGEYVVALDLAKNIVLDNVTPKLSGLKYYKISDNDVTATVEGMITAHESNPLPVLGTDYDYTTGSGDTLRYFEYAGAMATTADDNDVTTTVEGMIDDHNDNPLPVLGTDYDYTTQESGSTKYWAYGNLVTDSTDFDYTREVNGATVYFKACTDVTTIVKNMITANTNNVAPAQGVDYDTVSTQYFDAASADVTTAIEAMITAHQANPMPVLGTDYASVTATYFNDAGTDITAILEAASITSPVQGVDYETVTYTYYDGDNADITATIEPLVTAAQANPAPVQGVDYETVTTVYTNGEGTDVTAQVEAKQQLFEASVAPEEGTDYDFTVGTGANIKYYTNANHDVDNTTAVETKISNYVEAPQVGVDYDYAISRSGSTHFYKVDDTGAVDLIISGRFGLDEDTKYLEVTTDVLQKKADSETNKLPQRGEDYDYIISDEPTVWENYEFVNLKGQLLGDITDTDNSTLIAGTEQHAYPWYVQEFYIRSGDLSTEVFIDNIILNGESVIGATDTKAVEAIAENTFGTHNGYAAGELVEGKIEAALRIAFIDDDGNLMYVFRMSNGNWEALNAESINMAALLYNQMHNDETLMADSLKELDSVTMFGNDYPYLGTTERAVGAANTVPYQMHITMVMWLEGKDGDCLDSIINDNLSVQLSFTGLQGDN